MMNESVLSLALATLLPLSGYAKAVSLYSQPQDKTSVVTQVKSGDELITIFTPKQSQWMKVADPRNGKVGWVKKSDLEVSEETQVSSVNKLAPNSPKMYRQKIEHQQRDNNGNVIGKEHVEYYGTERMSREQLQHVVQRMRMQHMRMMDDMHQMMSRMWGRHAQDPFGDPWFAPNNGNASGTGPQNHPPQQRPDRIVVPNGQDTNIQHIR